MNPITLEQLQSIMPGVDAPKATGLLGALNAAMAEFEINTPTRQAAFLAQIAHESGELKWFRELWGPTPAQRGYEPPGAKAKALGNTDTGDGKRYRGRGPIQITGRANYRQYGALLGLPLEARPELAEQPAIGFRIAGAFWRQKGLNGLADGGQFQAITKRINGGFNGMDARLKYFSRAKKALGL